MIRVVSHLLFEVRWLTMTIKKEVAELTSDESSIAVMAAAMFGFSPTRQDWFRHADEVIAERMRSPEGSPARSEEGVGWWREWSRIGIVTNDESKEFSEAVRSAAIWYDKHPADIPAWVNPRPNWYWDVWIRNIESSSVRADLKLLADFVEKGAFDVDYKGHLVRLDRRFLPPDIEPPSRT